MDHPKYKLTYFNIRGRAEPIRMIFAVAKVPFEDHRIDKETWPNVKNTFPWDQIPVLEIDGKILAQSVTICRYLARKYNLIGESDSEAAKCDEYVDALMDARLEMKKAFFEPDPVKKEVKKNEFINVYLHKFLDKFEAIGNKNPDSDFLVGRKLTWADIMFANTVEFYVECMDPKLLDSYPQIKKNKDAVYNVPEIKDWIAHRPETPTIL